jgi:hypothetical protein
LPYANLFWTGVLSVIGIVIASAFRQFSFAQNAWKSRNDFGIVFLDLPLGGLALSWVI